MFKTHITFHAVWHNFPLVRDKPIGFPHLWNESLLWSSPGFKTCIAGICMQCFEFRHFLPHDEGSSFCGLYVWVTLSWMSIKFSWNADLANGNMFLLKDCPCSWNVWVCYLWTQSLIWHHDDSTQTHDTAKFTAMIGHYTYYGHPNYERQCTHLLPSLLHSVKQHSS